MLFPVYAAELITDSEKYKKAVKLASVTTAALYEGLYAMREMERRRRRKKISHSIVTQNKS